MRRLIIVGATLATLGGIALNSMQARAQIKFDPNRLEEEEARAKWFRDAQRRAAAQGDRKAVERLRDAERRGGAVMEGPDVGDPIEAAKGWKKSFHKWTYVGRHRFGGGRRKFFFFSRHHKSAVGHHRKTSYVRRLHSIGHHRKTSYVRRLHSIGHHRKTSYVRRLRTIGHHHRKTSYVRRLRKF